MSCACSSGGNLTLRLVNRIDHNNETVSFDFEGIIPVFWNEGDSSKLFLNLGDQIEGKKFSYASLSDEGVIRFTTRIREQRSLYKNQMNNLKIGDMVEVSSPNGQFSLRRNGKPALLLSNGVGIATMRSLIKAFAKNQEGVYRLTQVNVDNTGRLFEEEFNDIISKGVQMTSRYAKHREEFYQIVDFESQKLLFGTGIIPTIYVVGSDSFIIDVTSYLLSVGFRDVDIVTDGHSLGGCGCSSGGGCGCGSNSTSYEEDLQVSSFSRLSIRDGKMVV